MVRAIIGAVVVAVLGAGALGAPAGRPRLVVLTDIGGDPDDQQAMVRLLAFANEFEIEGLIASAAGTPGELKQAVTKPELIRELVGAYGQVRENLAKHADGYPAAEELLRLVKSGNPNRGAKAIGEGQDTEGSRWLIAVVDRPDPRPVNLTIWGGQTDLAQALWRVRQDRGAAGLKAFIARLRVHDIDDQDKVQPWIFENFPDLFYILSKAPPGADKRAGAYRGMYLGGDEALTSREWVDAQVRVGHGPLGALYPTKTWTAPNPHGTMKEGDTPSWYYFLPNGLGDPARPEWGSWGGRFSRGAGNLYRDAADTVGKVTDPRATVWRWRPTAQAEFAARMDWCVKPRGEANHAPTAVLNGDRSKAVVAAAVAAGQSITLSAAGSSDPDGQEVRYRWWVYAEAGTYSGSVRVRGTDGEKADVAIPPDAAGKTIHVILELRDAGAPVLTAYRRAVIEVR